jgi:hypothetical protein
VWEAGYVVVVVVVVAVCKAESVHYEGTRDRKFEIHLFLTSAPDG